MALSKCVADFFFFFFLCCIFMSCFKISEWNWGVPLHSSENQRKGTLLRFSLLSGVVLPATYLDLRNSLKRLTACQHHCVLTVDCCTSGTRIWLKTYVLHRDKAQLIRKWFIRRAPGKRRKHDCTEIKQGVLETNPPLCCWADVVEHVGIVNLSAERQALK